MRVSGRGPGAEQKLQAKHAEGEGVSMWGGCGVVWELKGSWVVNVTLVGGVGGRSEGHVGWKSACVSA